MCHEQFSTSCMVVLRTEESKKALLPQVYAIIPETEESNKVLLPQICATIPDRAIWCTDAPIGKNVHPASTHSARKAPATSAQVAAEVQQASFP